MKGRYALLCATLALAGCSDEPLVVEVGTGALHFTPIEPGSEVGIVCGPQGGQHIWTSVRALHAAGESVSIAIAIRIDGTGETTCQRQLDDVPLVTTGDWGEYAGIICFVPSPDAIRGRIVTLEGTVTDGAGRSVSSSVRFIPTGPPQDCAAR